MKMIRIALAGLLALCIGVAHAQSVSGNNSSNSQSSTTSASTTSNYFTSPTNAQYGYDYHYDGQYTVKSNASVAFGAFAPSMSGYNCAATAQAGGSQANAGLTAILGFPVLLDPGMICVFLTVANMDLQQAIALAPYDKAAAMVHLHAAEANVCNVGEVYAQVRAAQRASGIDCPLGKDEVKQVDKSVEAQYRVYTRANSNGDQKPFAPGVDLNVENTICGDEPSPSCIARIQKRINWKARELTTPSVS